MKKLVILLSFTIVGCTASKTAQQYPHYHTKPAITQGADESTYWESVVKVPPRYPRNALTGGISGCSRIGFTITPGGTVADPFVISSFPEGVFDHVSIETALQFTYRPSITNVKSEAVISSNMFTYGRSEQSFEALSAKCK